MSDYMTEVRANIAAAQQAEKARIDKLVKEASKSTERWAAEQALAQRQAEQAQEAALVERARQQEQSQRDDAQRAYLCAGGQPADFDAWYVGERARQVTEKLANQRAAALRSYAQSF
jgi:6-phosphogluconate dehydrogenase